MFRKVARALVVEIAEQSHLSSPSISVRLFPSPVWRASPLIYGEFMPRLFEKEEEVTYKPPSRLITSWLSLFRSPQISKGTAQYLVGDARRIYEVLLAIVCTKGISSRIQPKSIKVYEFYDPEEGDRQLVLQVEVIAETTSALAYWEAIGRAIDEWRESLPPILAEKVTQQWSMRILW